MIQGPAKVNAALASNTPPAIRRPVRLAVTFTSFLAPNDAPNMAGIVPSPKAAIVAPALHALS